MVGIMNKAKFETNDLSISNIKKISEIFPNCITEVKNKTGEIIPSINFELIASPDAHTPFDRGIRMF